MRIFMEGKSKSKEEFEVLPITSNIEERMAIVEFLVNFEGEERSSKQWYQRMAFWWEENPFFDESLPRGWILKANGKIVGIFGVIITDYEYQGKKYKALNITTWRVLKDYRNHSMALFYRLTSNRDKYILIASTPNETVEKVFQAFKFSSNKETTSMIFPVKCSIRESFLSVFVNALVKFYSVLLPKGDCRLIQNAKSLIFKDLASQVSSYLAKHKNSEYLEWYCFKYSPKEVVGYFNKNNELSSFVIVGREFKRKMHISRIIDYYMGDDDGRQILSIINYICTHPQNLNTVSGSRFLVLDIFSNNEEKIKKPFFIIGKKSRARHYYTLPQELRGAKMLNYLAEGDIGL